MSRYPEHLTKPMSQELENIGFKSLRTEAEVIDTIENSKGTLFVVVNSICGCAAGNARPGAAFAMQNENLPDNAVTVFAGVDLAATEKMREYMLPYPPSSPSMALFKEGKLVHFIERHHIEGANAYMIAANLKKAFDHFCNKTEATV